MRKILWGIFLMLGCVAIGAGIAIAQAITATTPSQFTAAPGSVHTSCLTPAAGDLGSLCIAGDGTWAWGTSCGGTTLGWVQIPQAPCPAAAGVTSLTTCNAAGTSCNPPQTGAVVVDIPKTATLQ